VFGKEKGGCERKIAGGQEAWSKMGNVEPRRHHPLISAESKETESRLEKEGRTVKKAACRQPESRRGKKNDEPVKVVLVDVSVVEGHRWKKGGGPRIPEKVSNQRALMPLTTAQGHERFGTFSRISSEKRNEKPANRPAPRVTLWGSRTS